MTDLFGHIIVIIIVFERALLILFFSRLLLLQRLLNQLVIFIVLALCCLSERLDLYAPERRVHPVLRRHFLLLNCNVILLQNHLMECRVILTWRLFHILHLPKRYHRHLRLKYTGLFNALFLLFIWHCCGLTRVQFRPLSTRSVTLLE